MNKSRLDLTPYIQDVSRHTVMQMATAVRNAWIEEAKSRLNTTANSYIEGIKMSMNLSTQPRAEVYLEGSWANKLEHGFKPYDMKPFMARSNKKKLTDSGEWYLHVPFRHTTPAATGKTGRKMPNSVYRQARKLPRWGKLSSGDGSLGNYEGLQKVPESPTSKRSAYMTWRTVSENSPSDAFIHPGFAGVHIARDLQPTIADTFSNLFKSNISNALGDNTR